MYIYSLFLQNFRSFKKKNIGFSPKITLITGPNAVGKTNILEALYLLATGKSFRASKESEMIHQDNSVSIIQGILKDKVHLEIVLTTGEVQGKKVARKLYKVNKVGRRWKDFFGHFRCVLFNPEDISLILGSPSIRRSYLNSVLEQIDWQYRVCNLAYKKGLRQRNKLLDRIREGKASSQQLTFWNQMLIKNGEIISKKRKFLIDFYNDFFTNFESFSLLKQIEIDYDKSAISESRLQKYATAELATGSTLVGPHRDDLVIRMYQGKTKRNLQSFGSRGEQRLAILAAKLAELEFISKVVQKRPTLLLDDIFSELDKTYRKKILQIIYKQQTIMSATERNLVEKSFWDKIQIIDLNKITNKL